MTYDLIVADDVVAKIRSMLKLVVFSVLRIEYAVKVRLDCAIILCITVNGRLFSRDVPII